jgi:general secretion pathway protein G
MRDEMKEQNDVQRAQNSAEVFSAGKTRFHLSSFRFHSCSRRGFTLLELLIVMSIIVILAAVVLPLYQQHVHRAREVTLRASLNEMRRVIDLYASDKGRFPQSPDDLVTAGYLREIPVDPVTGERDWRFETGSDPNFSQDAQGITNVRSSSSEISSEGTPYSEW